MLGERRSGLFRVFLLMASGATFAMVFAPRLFGGQQPDSAIIAEGGGTTIIQGGTGTPGFLPVLTK